MYKKRKEKKLLDSLVVPLKVPEPNLLRLIPFELQHHQGSSLKGTSGIQGGTEVSALRARAGEQLSARQKGR